jgi:hypothetical protein
MKTMKNISVSVLLLTALFLSLEAYSQKLPGTRQIHLDFHTSEHIPDIGASFSKKQFQEALQTAHVNLINIFAKGHHSWSYYPTKVGMVHPNLDFDFLGAQIEACHEIGVECPIYFTSRAGSMPMPVRRIPCPDLAGSFFALAGNTSK